MKDEQNIGFLVFRMIGEQVNTFFQRILTGEKLIENIILFERVRSEKFFDIE